MRILLLILIIPFSLIIKAQDDLFSVVRNVDATIIGGNKVQITYDLDPEESDAKYKISASVIMDSGEEITLTSLRNDAGSGISGRGRKTIIWEVFDQMDYFQGRYLHFKVYATKENSIGETLGGAVVSTGKGIWYLFAGSEETQNAVNGVILFGGYPIQNFSNDHYKFNKDDGVLKLKQAWSAGFRYQVLPLIFTLDYSQSKYDLNLMLPAEEEIYAQHDNISGELNLTFLPIIQQIIPSAGVGYQYGFLHKGDYKNTISTPGLYIDGMVEINLGILSLAATYRKSFTNNEDRGWDQILLSAGLNFGGVSSSTTNE